MSILIKGMEMPKENEVICIFPNGIVQKRVIKWSMLYEVLERSNAVPVPPHGDLIDRDALMRHKGYCYDANGHLLYAIGTGNIMCAPTVIEAEEGE